MENLKVFVVVKDEAGSFSRILGVFSSRVDAQEFVYGMIRAEFFDFGDDVPDEELLDEIAGSGINFTIESHYLR